MKKAWLLAAGGVLAVSAILYNRAALFGGDEQVEASAPVAAVVSDALYHDTSDGADWPGYGRTYGEQHFSPLTQIDADTVGRLGLAWSMDLDPGNPVTVPVAADGIVYLSSGLSIVQAIDAATGRQLWRHDPKVGEVAGDKLRPAWGIRGLAYWNGKVYTGTQDGRLIALDAKTGRVVWTAQTTQKDDGRYITGAPRIFDGKIIIGHGGADSANTRAYVTTYDAETGAQLWRFFIVPGNPADGFEDETQAMAAKTWTGKWWEYGGGGTAWNAFTYDRETDTILIGTGNGAPWNHRIRSPQGGDNLFLCSMVALDAKTGKYKWHYQFNPGETWDYNAVMDMALADLTIDGTPRKVVMTAPKNGFFYVIDRTDGKLISAEKLVRVTWAERIDLKTGRPVEHPDARFPDGKSFELWPNSLGAHNWMAMAFSPQTGFAYIPTITAGAIYSDKGIDYKTWKRLPGNATEAGVMLGADPVDPDQNTSALQAWDPVTNKRAWQVKTVSGKSGGVLATGGNLLFQGQMDGRFSAYSADRGKELWHFAAQAPVLAAPITYKAGGRQYVTVAVGLGTGAGVDYRTHQDVPVNYRTQRRRLLTFVLDGKASLPPPDPAAAAALTIPKWTLTIEPARARAGEALYYQRCFACHGIDAVAGGGAPDLRAAPAAQTAEGFRMIVHDGALVASGMPKFGELSDEDLLNLRHYLGEQAALGKK